MLVFQAPGDKMFRLKDCQSTWGALSSNVGRTIVLCGLKEGDCLVFLAAYMVLVYGADDHLLL